MSKQNQIILGVLAVVVIGLVAVLGATYMNGNSGNNSNNSQPTEITVSENAKSFKLGGSHAEGFKKMIFDPFALKSGEKQQVVVILSSDLKADEVQATLKDESGKTTKEMKSGTLDGAEAYFLSWQPEKVNPGNYYPVTVKYTSQADVSNAITLSWKSE